MKKKIFIMALLVAIITTTSAGAKTKDKNKEEHADAYRVRCTCYLPTGNKTAGGVYPYEGIIATNKEHLGQTAALYTEDMEFIGYFESLDTGGHEGLKNGTRIDVYRKNMKRAKKWIKKYGDYVYIEWIDDKEGEKK